VGIKASCRLPPRPGSRRLNPAVLTLVARTAVGAWRKCRHDIEGAVVIVYPLNIRWIIELKFRDGLIDLAVASQNANAISVLIGAP